MAALLAGCAQAPQGKPPSPVEVAEVQQKDIDISLTTIGTIYGLSTNDVRPQVTGQLILAHVEQGQLVRKGDLLFSIDPAPFQAAVDKAKGTLAKDKADLALAKTKMERNRDLVKKDYISAVAFDEFVATVEAESALTEVDEAVLKQAEIDLERTNIFAFTDGKIGRFFYYPGNIVSPVDPNPITTLEEISQVYVNFTVPQKEFYTLSHEKKLKVDIVNPNDGSLLNTGEVVFIDNHIDPLTGTLLMKALVKNDKQNLWPGQFVRVKLILETVPNALVVPESAVVYGQKGAFVYVVDKDNTVAAIPVKKYQTLGNEAAITGDLKPGATVVTLGQMNLQPGYKVAIKNGNPP
jgi:multidrug efflux system membrane fusion protein